MLKLNVKNTAKGLFHSLGLSRLFIRSILSSKRPRLLILTYHKIYPSIGRHEYIGLPQRVFEEQIRFIKKNFIIMSTREGLRKIQEENAKGLYVSIDLDDGYMDNYINAYPILKKYKVPATIYLTTDFIGRRHAFWWDKVYDMISRTERHYIDINIDSQALHFNLEGESQRESAAWKINSILLNKDQPVIEKTIHDLEKDCGISKDVGSYSMLGWEEIREMSKNGISFGSHTKTHRNLRLLSDADAGEELKGSKGVIEKELGLEVREFCYPYGMFDERIKKLASEAEFEYGRTITQGFNSRDADRFSLKALCGGNFFSVSHLVSRMAGLYFKRG